MPADRDRSSTYTLSQQIRCILNQRLIKILCQGCSQKVKQATVFHLLKLKICISMLKIRCAAIIRMDAIYATARAIMAVPCCLKYCWWTETTMPVISSIKP